MELVWKPRFTSFAEHSPSAADDELWIFVNGKLALDVGGQHQALEGTIDFDLQAAALDITVGSTYPMDIFHAERQTTDSNFHIETNITCFEPSTVVK